LKFAAALREHALHHRGHQLLGERSDIIQVG